MTTPDPSREADSYEEGAWYWVEREVWANEPKRIAPAMYKADCDAWYSYEFSGIPTRALVVLEPCQRHAAMAHKGVDCWQPIETAPRDGTKFLAYRPLAHVTHDANIKLVKGTPHNYGCWEATVPPGYSLENFTDGACRATHWQPLPAAPKQEGST